MHSEGRIRNWNTLQIALSSNQSFLLHMNIRERIDSSHHSFWPHYYLQGVLFDNDGHKCNHFTFAYYVSVLYAQKLNSSWNNTEKKSSSFLKQSSEWRKCMAVAVFTGWVGFGLQKIFSIYFVKSIATFIEMVSAMIKSQTW